MLIPDHALAEIDEHAEGNRSAFMVSAALDRTRKLRREALDREIIASLERDAEADAADFGGWAETMNDGLE